MDELKYIKNKILFKKKKINEYKDFLNKMNKFTETVMKMSSQLIKSLQYFIYENIILLVLLLKRKEHTKKNILTYI